MKKILKPAEHEEAAYCSDFSGICFGRHYPPVELNIEFNYGSIYDGAVLNLHLTDAEVNDILEYFKERISEDYKNILKNKLKREEGELDTSLQFRDWNTSVHTTNSIELINKMLGIVEE